MSEHRGRRAESRRAGPPGRSPASDEKVPGGASAVAPRAACLTVPSGVCLCTRVTWPPAAARRARPAARSVRLEQATVPVVGDSTCLQLRSTHSSKDAIRRRRRGGARPQDPIRAHGRRYGPRDHHCGWCCAECSGSGAVAGGSSSSSGWSAACCGSFWRVAVQNRLRATMRPTGAAGGTR